LILGLKTDGAKTLENSIVLKLGVSTTMAVYESVEES